MHACESVMQTKQKKVKKEKGIRETPRDGD